MTLSKIVRYNYLLFYFFKQAWNKITWVKVDVLSLTRQISDGIPEKTCLNLKKEKKKKKQRGGRRRRKENSRVKHLIKANDVIIWIVIGNMLVLGSWVFIIWFIKRQIFFLFERQHDRKRGRDREIEWEWEREISHSLVHFFIDHNSHCWARPKPGIRNSIQIFHVSGRNLST